MFSFSTYMSVVLAASLEFSLGAYDFTVCCPSHKKAGHDYPVITKGIGKSTANHCAQGTSKAKTGHDPPNLRVTELKFFDKVERQKRNDHGARSVYKSYKR